MRVGQCLVANEHCCVGEKAIVVYCLPSLVLLV